MESPKLKTEVYIGFIPIKIIALLQENNGFCYIIDTKAAMIGSLLESENKGSQFFKNQEFSIMLANKS